MLQVLQEPRTVFPGAPPIPHGAQPVLNGSQLTLRVAHPFVKDAPHNAQPVHKVTKIILHGAQPVAQDAQPVLQGFQPVPQDAQPMLQEAQPVLNGRSSWLLYQSFRSLIQRVERNSAEESAFRQRLKRRTARQTQIGEIVGGGEVEARISVMIWFRIFVFIKLVVRF